MALPLKVLKTEETYAFDELNRPVTQLRLTFKVGDHGPFYKVFPKDGFSSVTARLELEAFARELEQLPS